MDKKEIAKIIREEPYLIGKYLGFDRLTPLNNQWIVEMLQRTEDQTKQAHRGSYKTTCLEVFLTLHTITRPNENVMMFRKTDTDVAEVLNAVAKMLESELIKNIVRIVYGVELQILKHTNSEIHTNLSTYAKGTSQILGLGIGSSITGKHADIVITDDIVNVKDRTSRAERERTKIAFMELQNIKNRGGRFINLGTPWHKDDCFTLMQNIEKWDCYQTGLISKEELRELRQTMSDSLFSANYELKHIADSDALFKNPQFEFDDTKLMGGVAHIDASYGGSDGTAYTILKREGDKVYAMGKRWNKHIDDCLNEIQILHSKYQAGLIYNELNADKGYLAKEMRSRGLMVKTYTEHMNKYVKIATYLKKEWSNIYWVDTDPEYLDEVLDFTEFAEHDDAPDSIASLIRESDKSAKAQVKTFKGGI